MNKPEKTTSNWTMEFTLKSMIPTPNLRQEHLKIPEGGKSNTGIFLFGFLLGGLIDE